MGIFDFFKNKKKIGEAPILVNEKMYYREDEYYTKKTHEDTLFEQEVITLDERKRIASYRTRVMCKRNIITGLLFTRYISKS